MTGTSQLYRSSFALFVTTVFNGVLGLAFWIAAARSYSPSIVGLAAGGLSAVQLVGTVGWGGLQFTVLRYLPVAGTRQRVLLAHVYAAGGAASLVCAVVLVLFGSQWLGVRFISENLLGACVFCASAIVWVVFSLQDSVLVAVRKSVWVPVENLVFGMLKLGAVLMLASVESPWVIFGVWIGASAVIAAAVNSYLFTLPDVGLQGGEAATLPPRVAVAKYSVGQTGTAVLALLPDFLVPLMVIRLLGQEDNAFYYAAWTLGASMRSLSSSISSVLITEAAHDSSAVPTHVRSATRLAAGVLVPVMLVALAVPHALLSVFGEGYDAGVFLLRCFALSLVPFTIAGIVISLDRINGRFALAMSITATGTVITFVLDLILIPELGISGAGIGWLVGQTAAAVVAVGSYWHQTRRVATTAVPAP